MNTTWEQLSGLLDRNSLIEKTPLMGEFELTARCNLKCRMCYICRNTNEKEIRAEERSVKEWVWLASKARDQGMLFLLLTGGEVFLRQDFKDIYNELSQMGLIISIYSNGTLIHTEIASWLGNTPPSRIEITLYGASPETYGRVCGNAAGYYKAINGIKLLRSQGIPVQLRTTIIKENLADYEKMKELAENFGSTLNIVNYVSPRREGDGTIPEQMRLSPEELAAFEKYVNPINGRIIQRDFSLDKKEKDLLKALELDNAFPCNCGRNTFWITWDGRMIPCSLLDKISTHPFEEGFAAAWEKLKKLCGDVPACKKCSACSLQEYCISCPASLMNEAGSYVKPAPYLCRLAKERSRINRSMDLSLKEV